MLDLIVGSTYRDVVVAAFLYFAFIEFPSIFIIPQSDVQVKIYINFEYGFPEQSLNCFVQTEKNFFIILIRFI